MSPPGRPEGEYRSAKHEGSPVRLPGRRRALLGTIALLVSGLVAAPVAVAQDARSSAAQKAAREWLAFADDRNATAAWNAAGAKFRNTLPAQRWMQTLQAQRAPYGALVQRTVVATQFTRSTPRQPPGDYAVLLFRTAFAKKTGATETVTLEREPDGVWRVVGYVIN